MQPNDPIREVMNKVLDLEERFTLLRKLVDEQAKAIGIKIINIERTVEAMMNRKPDPRIIREAWIKRLPAIQTDLHLLKMDVAKMKALKEVKE